jgi:hypothetical protein
MNVLGFFGLTTKIVVTVTAPVAGVRFIAGGAGAPAVAKYRYLVTADATCFIQRNADSDATSSALLIANLPYEISMFAGDTLSYITGTGSANLYVTQIG